jgi:hypothetical protein
MPDRAYSAAYDLLIAIIVPSHVNDWRSAFREHRASELAGIDDGSPRTPL